MKIISVEGIVVSSTPYKESSKILNIFTKDMGIIGCMSKGCKSLKSKLRLPSEKFAYGVFHMYYKENGLSTLIDGDIKDYLINTKSDIIKISYLTYICELSVNVYKESENEEIYPLMISAIKKIEEGHDPKIITNILELKLLDYLGVGISFNSCAKCGSTHNIVTIDPDIGGYICQNCYTNEILYDEKTLKMLRMYYLVDINTITDLKISDKVIKNINYFVNAYYDRYTGLYLKSKKFLNEMIS